MSRLIEGCALELDRRHQRRSSAIGRYFLSCRIFRKQLTQETQGGNEKKRWRKRSDLLQFAQDDVAWERVCVHVTMGWMLLSTVTCWWYRYAQCVENCLPLFACLFFLSRCLVFVCTKNQKTDVLFSVYSGSHLFYAKLWTVADQKRMVKKIWKKYEKSWDGLPSSPKSKRGQKPFGITIITFPHFLRTLGDVSTSNVPSYQWLSWQLRTRRAASVRMLDHKREWCTVCSQCAPQPWTSHPFFLDEKGPVRSFPATFVWFYLEK